LLRVGESGDCSRESPERDRRPCSKDIRLENRMLMTGGTIQKPVEEMKTPECGGRYLFLSVKRGKAAREETDW